MKVSPCFISTVAKNLGSSEREEHFSQFIRNLTEFVPQYEKTSGRFTGITLTHFASICAELGSLMFTLMYLFYISAD